VLSLDTSDVTELSLLMCQFPFIVSPFCLFSLIAYHYANKVAGAGLAPA